MYFNGYDESMGLPSLPMPPCGKIGGPAESIDLTGQFHLYSSQSLGQLGPQTLLHRSM